MGRNRKGTSTHFARLSLLSGAAEKENLVRCDVVVPGIFKDCSSVSGLFVPLDTGDVEITNLQNVGPTVPTAQHQNKHNLYLL
jgi:hypothetical protein